MFRRITAAVLSAVVAAAAFTGCAGKNDISNGAGAKDFPATIGDVTISGEPAGAAVLSPNIASVILSLGYEAKLKAKSADCTQSDLSVLTNVTADDADKIKSLGATLVFADSLTDAQKGAFQKDGITVLTLKPATSRTDLNRLYWEVGSALKGANTGYNKGKTMAQGVFQTIDDITRMIPESNKPVTAAYLTDADGGAATGDTLPGKLIEAAGLTNVAASSTAGKLKSSDLLLSNPQYLFCAKGVKEKIANSSELKKLDAVKNNKVYEMDPRLMQLQGEELVEAVSFMAGTVHPELLQTVSSGSSSQASASSVDLDLTKTLQKGMSGDNVMKLQKRLEELGYLFVKPTGTYAEGTEQSVKDFQYLNGITVTGVADPSTLKKLFSTDAQKRTK